MSEEQLQVELEPEPGAGSGAGSLPPAARAGALGIEQIMAILPQRYPFLMVDRILESDGKTRIVGLKNLTVNEPFFQGHFPGHPVLPGVLHLEAMAQVAGILLTQTGYWSDCVAYFMSMDKVKFRRPAGPGDSLIIEVRCRKWKRTVARVRGEIRVDGVLVSEAELTLARVVHQAPQRGSV